MNNVVKEYDYYTLEQAREIILDEIHEQHLERRKRGDARVKERRNLLKQQAMGVVALAAILIGVLARFPLEVMAAYSIFMGPLGITLLIIKNKIM